MDCIENCDYSDIAGFCGRPLWNDFCSAPQKNQTLSAVKEQAGVRSERIYVQGGKCKSLWRKVSLCFVLKKLSSIFLFFVLMISLRHGGDTIQIAVATLKQMN